MALASRRGCTLARERAAHRTHGCRRGLNYVARRRRLTYAISFSYGALGSRFCRCASVFARGIEE
jgi:hypothetical protein